MPLPVALVFHFNQHTNEYADLANRACYAGLLRVLRAHPQLKINLHISGTLLHAWQWFDTDSLTLVYAGLADGQFELLGSTYAQNIPYASDDWDNAQQIGLHRLVLKEQFGVEPTVFWNAERCWRPSLAPVLTEAGYTTTLVEDHILHAAGLAQPTPAESAALTLVYDDTLLRARFNYAAWFGRPAQLLEYLRQVAARPGSENFLLAYAEDAEAMGLWGWEKGYIPNATWAHLDNVLTEIENAGFIELRHVSRARPHTALGALPHGAAQWMNLALLNPHAPYHEDHFSDWFDFNLRSPKTNYFRKLYAVVRTRLQMLGSTRQDPGFPRPPETPGDLFYRQALEAFCHHQYEFGCIGVGGRRYWGWENVRIGFMFAMVTELADEPEPYNWIEDINGDGTDEQLLCDGQQLAILTGHGGRLLFGFDLTTGAQWAGNHLAIPLAEYADSTTLLAKPASFPRHWLPTTWDADLKPLKAYRDKERPPTAMGRHLPAWVYERDAPALTIYQRKMRQPKPRAWCQPQSGLFTDTFVIDADLTAPADDLLDYRMEPGGVLCYLIYPTDTLAIEKRISQTADGVRVHYTFLNPDAVAHNFRLTSAHELNPDYTAVVQAGRAALAFYEHEARWPGVINTRTRNALVFETSQPWTRVNRTSNLLALDLRFTFDLPVPAQSQTTLEIILHRVKG